MFYFYWPTHETFNETGVLDMEPGPVSQSSSIFHPGPVLTMIMIMMRWTMDAAVV